MKSSIHQTSHSQINFHGLKIPVEDLYSHTLITGRPGSGKSRCCVRPLLRELVKLNASNPELKAGMLLLDGKGGELRAYLG
jgi:DNA segregation ATPase FtsK/SpoIIIE-like protein